jgi:hypothetical protein
MEFHLLAPLVVCGHFHALPSGYPVRFFIRQRRNRRRIFDGLAPTAVEPGGAVIGGAVLTYAHS